MNNFDEHRRQQRSCRQNDSKGTATSSSFSLAFCSSSSKLRRLDEEDDDDDLESGVVPAVTVVLEGRSICHRISLHKHGSYQSLAKALRLMFVEDNEEDEVGGDEDDDSVDLSNAIPGHVVAYEDMENDLLLAGDLNWK